MNKEIISILGKLFFYIGALLTCISTTLDIYDQKPNLNHQIYLLILLFISIHYNNE